jgi:surfactin synthase thioesterase subunit
MVEADFAVFETVENRRNDSLDVPIAAFARETDNAAPAEMDDRRQQTTGFILEILPGAFFLKSCARALQERLGGATLAL